MGPKERRVYLERAWPRYQLASRSKNQQILDEFCAVCGYNRKYAVGLLNKALQADTVAHCGSSLAGDFVWSLTMTDIHTGWTECRAVWGKAWSKQVHDIELNLPFTGDRGNT